MNRSTREASLSKPGTRTRRSGIRALQAINLVPDCVVHTWSVTGHNQTQAGDGHFKQAQELGFYSLLLLAKTLAKQNVRNGITLFALSNNIQEVNGKEPLRPEKSTLLGPCLVIPQEYPNIRVKSIDVEWSEITAANALTIDQVVGEFFNRARNCSLPTETRNVGFRATAD